MKRKGKEKGSRVIENGIKKKVEGEWERDRVGDEGIIKEKGTERD